MLLYCQLQSLWRNLSEIWIKILKLVIQKSFISIQIYRIGDYLAQTWKIAAPEENLTRSFLKGPWNFWKGFWSLHLQINAEYSNVQHTHAHSYNYIYIKLWDVITHACHNSAGRPSNEACMCNAIKYTTMDVITHIYIGPNLDQYVLVKQAIDCLQNQLCWLHCLVTILGLCSLSGRTSYSKISWSLEATKLDVIMTVTVWILTGI